MVTTVNSITHLHQEHKNKIEQRLPALSSAEGLVFSVQEKPERTQRLTTDEEVALENYGIGVRYMLSLTCEGNKSSFFTVPVTSETKELENHARMCGYVYCRPTQGRVSSINSTGPFFSELKGNGMSTATRSRAKRFVYWYTGGPYTFDGNNGFLGLLNESEATASKNFIELNPGIQSGSIADILYPLELPDTNYTFRPINALFLNKDCLGANSTFGTPVILERRLFSPATLADCLVLPFGTTDTQNASWTNFLGFGDDHRIGRIPFLSDTYILKKLQLIRKNAKPYIYSFLRKHPDTAYSDIAEVGVATLLSNYTYILKKDLSHNSLHVQNVRLLGEFSDVSDFVDSERLPPLLKEKRKRKDFISMYNAYLLQNIIFANADIMTPQEFQLQMCDLSGNEAFFDFDHNVGEHTATSYWLKNVTCVKGLVSEL